MTKATVTERPWGEALRKKTRTETRVEMREVWMITKPQGAPIVMCKECTDPQAAMLAPEAAAVVAGVSLRTLFRWVEAGKVHFLEQTDGTLLICSDSVHGDSAARTLLPPA